MFFRVKAIWVNHFYVLSSQKPVDVLALSGDITRKRVLSRAVAWKRNMLTVSSCDFKVVMVRSEKVNTRVKHVKVS